MTCQLNNQRVEVISSKLSDSDDMVRENESVWGM